LIKYKYNVAKTIVSDARKYIDESSGSRVAGRATFEIASLLIGTKGLSNVTKVGKVAKPAAVVADNSGVNLRPVDIGTTGLKLDLQFFAKVSGKTEKHHIATDKSKKFDFKNHPAFKETGINVSKDIDNLVDLANHRGRHTNKYHQEVQDRLDAVYNRYGGTDKLEDTVRAELRKMKQELLDGKLDPYGK
ncbi:hypothetical protein CU633_18420, partial [Bacillus sp. V3-13]|uniref:AHH domain-containing protein n=1 Tax=Bacillus sp. V3-13 TaxID=2053728 RepID=UPI000CC0F016